MNDPEAGPKLSLRQRLDEAGTDCENVTFVLSLEAKHDHPGAVCSRICPDVRESAVERDENSLLVGAHASDAGVILTAELLFYHAGAVPPGVAEELAQFFR